MVKDSSVTITIAAKPIEVKERKKKDEEKKKLQSIKEVYRVQLCDDLYYEPFYWDKGSFQKHVHWNS